MLEQQDQADAHQHAADHDPGRGGRHQGQAGACDCHDTEAHHDVERERPGIGMRKPAEPVVLLRRDAPLVQQAREIQRDLHDVLPSATHDRDLVPS